MYWHVILGTIARLMPIAATFPYVKDILHGNTRPNTLTWGVWALITIIAVLAQFNAGASWSIVMVIADSLSIFIIFGLCLYGFGYRTYGWLEAICFLLAIIAIVAWQVTHQPVLTIIFSIVADLFAALPTVVKAWRDPWSETPYPWLMVAFGGLCAVASTTIFDEANILFPAYLFVINAITGFIALIGRHSKMPSIA